MFNNLTYEKLTAITEKEKHYRHKKGHKTKCYPWDKRQLNNKYFTRPEGVDSYYDIYYENWNSHEPKIRIHKGNIVECVADYMDSGDIIVFSKLHEQGSFRGGWWSNGYQLTNMESRGGLCIAKITNRDKREYDIYPFRKGMKFDMFSDIPITKYDVYARQVDRKKSLKSYKEHENDFTVLETTFKGIDDPNLSYQFCEQVLKDNPLGDYEDNHDYDAWVSLALAKSQIDGLICSARDDIYMRSNGHRWQKPESIIDMLGKSYKDYLNEHYNNFKVTEYPCEKKYFPTNKLLKIQMRGE